MQNVSADKTPTNSKLYSTALTEHATYDLVSSILKILQWQSVLELICRCVCVCLYLSAGDGCVLSAHYCCGVCSCGYAPSLCPCHRTETSPSPSSLLDGHLLARVCVSLKWGHRNHGLCLFPGPSLCPGLCLLWQECGTVSETASASSCDQNPRCCCGVHWALSRCCHDGWFWTWGGGGGVRADAGEVMDCDCGSEILSENYRTLSGYVCCCNCGNKREEEDELHTSTC